MRRINLYTYTHSERVCLINFGFIISRAQVIGWPPVRSFRKKTLEGSSKLVKVAVDGAPYLRKVDLQIYSSYQDLFRALEEMFTCFTTRGNYYI